MGTQHTDGKPPLARSQNPHFRQQGRGLSLWQALSSAYAASARLRKDRPVVKGRQLHAFRRFHGGGERVTGEEMSANLHAPPRTPACLCVLTTAALINVGPIVEAAEVPSYC